MLASAESRRIFDDNRVRSRVAIDLTREHGRLRRSVDESGALRARFPNVPAGELEAVLVNTAGGIAGGDRVELVLSVNDGAALTVGGAAAEKVYRSHGPAAELSLAVTVGRDAMLAWLPQETILFDGARLSRRIDVSLAKGGRAVLAEALVFGRAAMAETLNTGALKDRWRVRIGDRLVFAETTRLDGDIRATLAHRATGGGAGAVATILVAPGDSEVVERVRAVMPGCRGECGISAWNGIAVARFVAADALALRYDMMMVLGALAVPLPRLWLQ